MTALALVLSALLAAGPGGSAAAADTGLSAADLQKAKDLFGAGQKLYKAASYGEAIGKFQEAYAVRPHPVILFNIAKCYEQLGETGKAMRAYRDYLRFSPDAKDKETVTDDVANLERRLKEKGQNQIIVFADPPTAKVEIDGKDVGTAPASAELTAGSHKFAVRAPGYESVERSFTMSISRASEMTINLKPGTPAIPTAETAGDAPRKDELKVATLSPTPVEPATTGAAPVVTSSTAPAAKKGRVWTYVAGGVAVAGLGGGIALGVLSNNASAQLKATEHSRADATALASSATQFSTGANIAYGVAAGVAITAVILFFVEK